MEKKLNILNSGIFNIISLIILFSVSYLFLKSFTLNVLDLSGTILTIVIALLPTLLWVFFYYIIDRKDPEPLLMILIAFISGVFCKIVFHDFIGKILFDIESWDLNVNSIPIVYTFFVKGLLPAFSIFFVLRYIFYPNKYFNEPVDGMIYGGIIGAGYVFIIVMEVIFHATEISLYYLIFAFLIKLPLFSACSSLIGYYFGIARFKPEKDELYFLLSLLVLIFTFTLYTFIDYIFKINILTSSDLLSIILTLVFTLVIITIAYILIQLSISKYTAKKMDNIPFFIDKVSLISLIILLVSGLCLRIYIERDIKFISENKKIEFKLPAKYNYESEYDNVISFSKKVKNTSFPVSLKIAFIIDKNPIAIGIKGKTIKDYNYMVTEKNELIKPIGNDNMNNQIDNLIYTAKVTEYTLTDKKRKIIFKYQSPANYKEDHFKILKKIINTLNWE